MPDVVTLVRLADLTPDDTDSSDRDADNCLLSVVHTFGFCKLTTTFTRDGNGVVTNVSHLVEDLP